MLINSSASLVDDALTGLVACNTHLQLLSEHRVVFLRASSSSVAVISGGGSGHEPSHAGLVGEGLLFAAVCGQLFASPSVQAVFAAIRVAARDVLLVVKNYTGDRLAFGLAMQLARAEGRRVEMVVVGDDVALPELAAPRGLCGTLFVHKVAGHCARAGWPLHEIAALCRVVAQNAATVGFSVGPCTRPDVSASAADATDATVVELGKGIHGEKGRIKLEFGPVSQLVAKAAQVLFDATGKSKAGRYACIVNNLGGCSGLEMQAMAKEFLSCASSAGVQVSHVMGPGSFMTSLDQRGVSFSIINLAADDRVLEALCSPCDCSAWMGFRKVADCPVRPVVAADFERNSATLKVQGAATPVGFELSLAVKAACDALVTSEAHLNELDRAVGDGDTGSTLSGAAKQVAHITSPDVSMARLLFEISTVFHRSGGTMGVLLAVLFAALSQHQTVDANALEASVKAVQEIGGAKRGDRTFLDALLPAIDALKAGRAVSDAASEAQLGADATATMRAKLGRSAYLSDQDVLMHPDPGAVACAIAFKAFADSKPKL
jgi:dihydroxyacetone kinase